MIILEWFSYVIAIAIGFSSIFSPIITMWLSNRHQIKIKEIDIYETAKRKALEDFVDIAQKVLYYPNEYNILTDYACTTNRLFIYFSDFTIDTIQPFDNARAMSYREHTPSNIQQANLELTKIVRDLAKQIKKL